MKKIIFLTTILLELIVVILILQNIIKKKERVLGSEAVNPIAKESLIFSEEGKLKYFYEPVPNETMVDSPEWLSYKATNTINSDGLNERFDYSLEKPANTFRIITIGDSHTFGHFVNTKDNYPEQLEDVLNSTLSCSSTKRFEVINFGERGYDIEYSLYRFNMRAKKYNPDLILWYIKDDDLETVNELFIGRIREIEEEINSATDSAKYAKLEYVYFAWRKAGEELSQRNMGDYIRSYNIELLDSFFESLTENILLFTYGDDIFSSSRSKIKHYSEKYPSKVYYFEDIFYSQLDRLPDGHPSVKGYKTLVDKLSKHLIEEKIIPCD